ncbi:MAG: hypothetical protein H7A21_14870 [Spirochaetales bacterium]|nr:hypothetical protein [Spirochaetales bacterium]MCP5485210.1 hypothetical protein [Spirochaetales bacterium]
MELRWLLAFLSMAPLCMEALPAREAGEIPVPAAHELPAEAGLFDGPATLEFRLEDNRLIASCRDCEDVGDPVVWNLEWQGEEFLFGQLRLADGEIRRCKLWPRPEGLYLRVYHRFRYSTHLLRPIATAAVQGAEN